MHISKAARRYATALLELGKERDEVKDLLNDMNFINNTMQDSRELVLFLQNPIIKYDDKQAVLEELFGSNVQESTRLFLKLLARKNRIDKLDEIAQAYIQKYNEYAGIIEVEVSVAHELGSDQQEQLLNKLEEITGKEVHLNINLDESLRGGMAVRIEDTVIDGTVKHKLQVLEEQLLANAIE